MGDISTAILSRLDATPAVTAILGSPTRIYPSYDREADRVYPLAVYTVEVAPQQAFDGPAGIDAAIYRIAALATTYRGASALAAAIRTALDGQRGTWDGVEIDGVWLQDDGIRDDVVTEPTTEEITYFVKSLSFDVRASN